MTQPSSELLWGAAIHEAGHAIAAIHYKLALGDVWINDYGDGGGGTHINLRDEGRLHTVDRLAVVYGGGAAQEHFNAPTNSDALAEDERRADEIVRHLNEAERLAAKAAGRVRALKIVIARADEAVKLARRLFEERRINLANV